MPVESMPLRERFTQGLDAPICLTWELTYACNLACVHCLSSSGRRDPMELTPAEARHVVDELADMKVFYVNIGGGEPMLRPDFFDLVSYAVERKVGKIDHVDGVRNHVMVDSSAPDADLQAKLSDRLNYDRIGQGITFNALTLKVEDGVVTVGGDVLDYPSRDSAIAIVETTPGVKDVIDEINVLPTSPFDDDLRIRVARAIYGYPPMKKYAMVPQKPIRIVVNNGHVTLYGVVDSKFDKQIAETRAKSVANVFSVDDQLIIAGGKGK